MNFSSVITEGAGEMMVQQSEQLLRLQSTIVKFATPRLGGWATCNLHFKGPSVLFWGFANTCRHLHRTPFHIHTIKIQLKSKTKQKNHTHTSRESVFLDLLKEKSCEPRMLYQEQRRKERWRLRALVARSLVVRELAKDCTFRDHFYSLYKRWPLQGYCTRRNLGT